MTEPKIVEAVGSAVNSKHAERARKISEAYEKAILEALEEGIDINDSEEILKRKAAARQRVLDEEAD